MHSRLDWLILKGAVESLHIHECSDAAAVRWLSCDQLLAGHLATPRQQVAVRSAVGSCSVLDLCCCIRFTHCSIHPTPATRMHGMQRDPAAQRSAMTGAGPAAAAVTTEAMCAARGGTCFAAASHRDSALWCCCSAAHADGCAPDLGQPSSSSSAS